MRSAAGASPSSHVATVAAVTGGAVMLFAAASEPWFACSRDAAVPFAAPTLSVPRVIVLGLVGAAVAGAAAWYTQN